MTDISAPDAIDWAPVKTIHDTKFLEFLETCWAEWVAEGYLGEILPLGFPARRMQLRRPNHIDGKIGYYCLATETAITKGTWRAAQASCAVAQTAQRLVSGGARSAFALCRPPGHHAASDMYGGYCFLNNAAITAQMFLDQGAAKVAILDVDFHHGNGTQDIFYERDDVQFVSLHGDPVRAYPWFIGHEDETGAGKGRGYNINVALGQEAEDDEYVSRLAGVCEEISSFAPSMVIV